MWIRSEREDGGPCGRRGRHGHGGPDAAGGVRGMRGMGRGPHGGRFGGPRGGGRRRGLFGGEELRLVLLKLIADTPRHGYDLIREIETRTGGDYTPSPGVVYPTLTMLQDMGLVEETAAEGARKAYAVTPQGAAHLDEKQAEVAALFERIAAVAAANSQTDIAPVRRAVHNLHTALDERLSREAADGDQMHRIAALLDEVTQKIERS